MSTYTRRRLLAVGSAITVAGLAGCSGAQNTADAGSTSDDSEQPEGPVLETVSLENLTDTPQSIDVIVQRDDTIEYWETHELDAINSEGDSGMTLDSGWPTDPDEFQLIVRLADDTRAQFSSTQLPERDCLDLVVLVSREGELSILTDVSGGSCSTDSADSADSTDDTSAEA